MFESLPNLLLGLLTGFVFGFLLQKGRVAKFGVITDQLLLRDWTVAKIMLTAIAVGGIGVYALVTMGLASLHIKPAVLGGVIVGGVLFGCGMAILGYCPGTTVAACGEGHRDALFGLAGMLAGSFTYVWLFPAWNAVAAYWGDAGKVTLPDISKTSPWPWVVALITALAVFRFVVRSSAHAASER
jgi:hypothetical protein